MRENMTIKIIFNGNNSFVYLYKPIPQVKIYTT